MASKTSTTRPDFSPPVGTRLHRKYRELISKHLGKLRARLFAEFTGLHFHITWVPPPHECDLQTPTTACSVCCRLSGASLLTDCRTCGPRQLARTLSKDGDGHHFSCRLGVLNYWFRIHVRGQTLGIAYLQGLDRRPPKAAQIHNDHRPHPPHEVRAKLEDFRQSNGFKQVTWAEFKRAGRLLQMIVQDVQAASLSDLRKADLTSAKQSVVALEMEQARLHEALQRHLPATLQTLHLPGPESHAETIIHSLMKSIQEDFAKPLTLQRCARELGMNAAYLSDLFSHVVGVPFKKRLTELRMEKAKLLLGNSRKNLSEVASAVGYASESCFRIAFKKATGLSPKLWRETMHTNPPQTSS